jgi:hypothetical protein
MEETFSTQSVLRCYKQDQLAYSGPGPQMGLDTKKDWPTDRWS